MQINQKKEGDIIIIEIEGEIDLYNSPRLRQQLTANISKGARKIVVDFNKVRYIDSSGLATLIEGFQKIAKLKGRLVLCSLSKSIMDIFEVSRLNSVFFIAATQEEALNVIR